MPYYKREGFDLDILEDIWTRLGAKVCLGEIKMNIIPLNKPNEMPDYGDSLILLQLANRIKGIISFEKNYHHRDGYKTQFHPSVFKDKA